MGVDEQFDCLVQLMNTSKPIKIGLFKTNKTKGHKRKNQQILIVLELTIKT